ncbi:MAG TPA: c-type cytochrome [Burkholderiales bacterium]|nr:c-type cytochrome [Burkholderiales bacterium]
MKRATGAPVFSWLCRLLIAVLVAAPTSAACRGNDADGDLELGRRVYNFRCYFCHGYSGDAKTTAAQYLTPKPRDFRSADATLLSRDKMFTAVARGRPGTAMQSYASILSEREIASVVEFVRTTFILARASNTQYHVAGNGWSDHARYRIAFPFVTGDIALDRSAEQLTPAQRNGRALYLTACVSCHDRRPQDRHEAVWESRPLSYPLHGDTPTNAAPQPLVNQYRLHERRPKLAKLSAIEQRGEALFQSNCSFCHGADGTGKNWIGSFLEPPARNLTGDDLAGVTGERLKFVIREGLPGTSMPAWKHVLDAREVEAVAAYVMRAFRSAAAREPAGKPTRTRSAVSASHLAIYTRK